jgi:hypothetical protein
MDSLIDVNVFDEEQDDEIVLLAKIVGETQDTYKVRFMSPTKGGLYRYENEVSEIDKESVCGYYDSKDERDAGFIPAHDGCFERIDDDDEYEPSDSEEDDDEDEELDDEEDEEEDENIV